MPFAEAAGAWIRIERGKGEDAIARIYTDMRAGKINPAEGHILGFK